MKKWTKILCFSFLFAFVMAGVLTGCATVGNIKNLEKEIIMNGTSAVMVGDHLYFGNAYAESVTSESEYSSASSSSYLARVNTKNFSKDLDRNFSPDVEKVSGGVVGYENNFMFVLGQSIYYATPNTQMITTTDSNGKKTTEHHYDYTTFYKSGLNGDGKQKLYTSTATVSQCEVLKCENVYYLVIYSGTNLVKINLSNNKIEEIEKENDVTSVALQKTYQKNIHSEKDLNFDGYIYYAINRPDPNESGLSGTIVKRVKLSGGESEVVYNQQSSVALLGRDKDYVFYSEKFQEQQWLCRYSVKENSESFGSEHAASRYFSVKTTQEATTFYRIESESKFYGYLFMIDNTIYYVSADGKSGTIKFVFPSGSEETDFSLLFVDGKERTLYISTSTSIYRVSLPYDFFNVSKIGNEVDCETIVSMTAIASNNSFAFDGEFIYFYGELEELPKEEGDEEENDENEETEEPDSTKYLYRASIKKVSEPSKNYQLLGLTKSAKRHSK